MTKEEKQNKFIDKLNKLYGNKYDYSKVDYYDSKSKITLICPIHGEFTINASELLKGCDCKKCRHEKEFIEKSKEIHNNKYDYSKVIYHHCNKPVCIICPEHGEFWQKPSHHLNGNGCKLCSKIKVAKQNRLTQNEFIEKANKIHNNRYDYSKSKYITWETPVCIICPEHGEFWQKPAQHLREAGCTKCHYDKIEKSKQEYIDEFKKQMISKFGNIIDFSEMNFKNSNTKIKLKCKIHGIIYEKTTLAFLKSKTFCNCINKVEPKKEKNTINYKQLFINKINEKYPNRFDCSNIEYVNSYTDITILDNLTNKHIIIKPNNLLRTGIKDKSTDFIEKAKKVHGDKYDYSKVEYIDSKTPVCIICPIHGEFWQKPNSHLSKHGCQKCAGNVKWNINDYITEAKKVHGNKYDYSKTIFKQVCDVITVTCPIHGEFNIRAHVHIRGGGCQKCNGSGGEQIVMTFLNNKNIKYDFNKFFKWMDKLQLDFYIPEYNAAIEVQGEQHFKENNFFDKLNEQLKRDNKKRKLCEENNVRLFYFATYKYDFPYKVYTDLNEMWKDIEST